MEEAFSNTPEEYYSQLVEILKKSFSEQEIEQIDKAYQLAKKAHADQKRRSGEPYLIHPVLVAKIVAEMGMDKESIIAALLHDVVEDTSYSFEDITELFGSEVAALVDGVTKLGKIPLSTQAETQAENVRKMLLAMSEDIRVIIIKLADRLHNMRTLQFMNEQKRRDKALETLEIYAPIAHRLGIRALKEELEDLAISYLDPVAYKEIEDSLALKGNTRLEFIENIKKRISERLEKSVPGAHIDGRIKSVHGIYRKMYMQGKNFDEIYDIYAVRIIVDTVVDCYNCLGIIHDMFRPIPGRFKDYISTPKPNMYQSLHTTVIGKEAIPFEVQIRTWEMHYTAEYGIAAHWKYKLGISGKAKFEERLSWIRQLLESQQDSVDVEDIVRTIKTDLAPEEVFVFTPKGDVISLPTGATVIDFAYAIHSAVGNKMTGAKIDGRIVPIDTQVKTGEIIDILTSSQPGKGPSRDWLKIVKTNEAKSKIRAWYKKERREENILEGKTEVELEFRRNNIKLPDDKYNEFLFNIALRQHCQNLDDFYAAIGYGGISINRLMPHIKEEYNKLVKSSPSDSPIVLATEKRRKKSTDGVIIEGIDNCLVKFSRCCNPLPGDEIIGFITRGHGVSIHTRECTNVPKDIEASSEPERWVKAYWDNNVKEQFKATLMAICMDRVGMLADVAGQLASMHVMIHNMTTREMKDGRSTLLMTITVDGVEHLNSVISKLKKIEGVQSIERSGI
ncbi:MAG: bifunctional (p)ppGpp synthetase/guanosine-3',5'-bis(diphosphate) 3'-pyrophosphohydrolase [Clostridiales bacterium]|nr:bifunctional (p)ppGpp synthetase/guanosine-3',5'-bis(diphosphate) 3'-pyrophosphohydrolase [Clostridiales bacterium]